MSETLQVEWRGVVVGEIRDALPDMWYLEGRWHSLQSDAAKEFEALAHTFDPRTVLKDPAKGTRAVLRDGADSRGTHAAIISLKDGSLFLRRYFEKEAVTWLLANVS